MEMVGSDSVIGVTMPAQSLPTSKDGSSAPGQVFSENGGRPLTVGQRQGFTR